MRRNSKTNFLTSKVLTSSPSLRHQSTKGSTISTRSHIGNMRSSNVYLSVKSKNNYNRYGDSKIPLFPKNFIPSYPYYKTCLNGVCSQTSLVISQAENAPNSNSDIYASPRLLLKIRFAQRGTIPTTKRPPIKRVGQHQ